MDTVICILNKSNWMRSLESAELSIISPTGRSITFRKKHLTKDCADFIHSIARKTQGEIELTRKEMLDFKRYAETYYK